MDLNLKRPLLFFDIESTGLNIVSDGIVELSFVKVFPDGHHEVKTWRVCPWDYSAAAIFLSLLPSSAQIRGFSQQRLEDWEFSKDGKTFQQVKLPHCCNAS